MPRYNKLEDFEAGLELLIPFFASHGYVLTRQQPYRDRSVLYSARFELPPRSVELHHEFSLGRVIYRMRDHYIEHTPYLQALGVASTAHYPSYEDDSRAGYPVLLHDLQTLLTPFFNCTSEEFAGSASHFMQRAQRELIAEERRLAYGGSLEERAKARARVLFFEKRYDEVCQIESQIRFPDFLTDPERQLFALARKRLKQ
jgi:hypothetical protein